MAKDTSPLVNFATDAKYAKYRALFGDDTALSSFVTNAHGEVLVFRANMAGKVLKDPVVCEEGSVIAVRPPKDQNIADEEFWFAVVKKSNEEGGDIDIRWLVSGAYAHALVEYGRSIILNSDQLKKELSDFSVPRRSLFLTDQDDKAPIGSIKAVLTENEFAGLGFEDGLVFRSSDKYHYFE
ncbi:unnamed protein product [Peniophora sp. CBMAI 1063]|nr:unnamed protein product [Peniophora sp. CBMAI 1063]